MTDARANLGRTEPWLRAIGLAVWAFCGLSRLDVAFHPWLFPWALYGVAVVALAARARLPSWVNVGLLAAQTAGVLAMPRLGLIGYEGLLASIVVVQIPLVLSLRASVIWAAVHPVLLVAAVFPFYDAKSQFEMVGAYSTFSAFALGVHWLRIQEQRARAELARSNVSLLATRAMLVEGSRQAERLRISRELHDSLGHHLTALALHLDLAQRQLDGRPGESVAQARAIAKESLTEVRKVVSAMQAEEGIDLVAALRALAGGIPAPRIVIRAPESLVAGDGETSHALFRCVQEAITNSVKHASARNIWVDVEREAAQLQITVCDDGSGVPEVTRGRGLTGMNARLVQLGGFARFESAPGQGFKVHLRLPLKAA